MNDTMITRGPDDEGYFQGNGIGLGMRRLSIIDLEGGHQPISNEDGRFTVVLNGEIYNYRELRQSLISRGHVFKTSSDTEVIVHLFEEWGASAVSELNGMFAFAVWDNLESKLFIARDRLGIKPLYYTMDEQKGFVFASTISALTSLMPKKKVINKDSFLYYMGFSYISCPSTIFRDIYKLEPATCMVVSEDGLINKERYWNLSPDINYGSSMETCRERFLSLFEDSVKLQMRSDVPVGTFLSGGLDSSLVVAMLSGFLKEPIRTFSVGFEGGVNETGFARLVADKFKTDHREFIIKSRDVVSLFSSMIKNLDEPLSDNALIPTLFLSEHAIKCGVKVVLNGSGGDEMFGGYERYRPYRLFWKLAGAVPDDMRIILGRMMALLDRDLGRRVESRELYFISRISGFNSEFCKSIFKDPELIEEQIGIIKSEAGRYLKKEYFSGRVKNMMYMDLNEYLPGDVLSLLDKMTMAVSLEGRVPFLDHRLVELAFSLPENIIFKGGRLKGFLRCTARGRVPDEILDLPKSGFAGPTGMWIRTALKSALQNYLINEPNDFLFELIDRNKLSAMISNEKAYGSYSEMIFSLFVFALWYRYHVERKEINL